MQEMQSKLMALSEEKEQLEKEICTLREFSEENILKIEWLERELEECAKEKKGLESRLEESERHTREQERKVAMSVDEERLRWENEAEARWDLLRRREGDLRIQVRLLSLGKPHLTVSFCAARKGEMRGSKVV